MDLRDLIKKMDLAQLVELRDLIPDELEKRRRAEKQAIIKEIQAKAALLGTTTKDLLNLISKQGSAKYQHPANPDKTWSGKGAKPLWVKTHLDSGGNLEELLIA